MLSHMWKARRPGRCAPRHEHVLEVLSGAPADAAVHVALVALLQPGPGAAPVVDDDHEPPARPQRGRARIEHVHDAADVRFDRRAGRSACGRTDLTFTQVVERR
jgi:hypothetical protein